MDKKKFFSSVALKSEKYTLPTKEAVQVRELTAGERQSIFIDHDSDGLVTQQARVVALAFDEFDEGDIDELLKLPGGLLRDMADKVLSLSGLDEEADPKKN